MISVLTGHNLLTTRKFSWSALYSQSLNASPITVSRLTLTPTVQQDLT